MKYKVLSCGYELRRRGGRVDYSLFLKDCDTGYKPARQRRSRASKKKVFKVIQNRRHFCHRRAGSNSSIESTKHKSIYINKDKILRIIDQHRSECLQNNRLFWTDIVKELKDLGLIDRSITKKTMSNIYLNYLDPELDLNPLCDLERVCLILLVHNGKAFRNKKGHISFTDLQDYFQAHLRIKKSQSTMKNSFYTKVPESPFKVNKEDLMRVLNYNDEELDAAIAVTRRQLEEKGETLKIEFVTIEDSALEMDCIDEASIMRPPESAHEQRGLQTDASDSPENSGEWVEFIDSILNGSELDLPQGDMAEVLELYHQATEEPLA